METTNSPIMKTEIETAGEHIVKAYDGELNSLAALVTEMGSRVEAMVQDSIKALKKQDVALADDVIARDAGVNALQEQIDSDAMRLLALRHPMAADLRLVIGCIRAANDLERIGDLAEGIARRAKTLAKFDKIDLTRGVTRMGKMVKIQLKAALDALLNEDADTAIEVWLQDADIDAHYASMFRELLTYMMEDHRNIQSCTGLLFAAKNLERIGDHATNIAEIVYFSVTGKPLLTAIENSANDEES